LLSRVALLLKEKQKLDERNSTASLSPEVREIDRCTRESFAVELEDDPFNFWNGNNDFPLIVAMACDIQYYAYQLLRPPLKEYSLPVVNQHLEDIIDSLIVTWKRKFY